MKKTKLSTIAINAETLAGKSPSFYDHTLLGLGGYVGGVSVTDFNNVTLKTGFYNTLSTAINKPSAASSGYLIHITTRVDLASQIFVSYATKDIWHRRKINDVWTGWFAVTTL